MFIPDHACHILQTARRSRNEAIQFGFRDKSPLPLGSNEMKIRAFLIASAGLEVGAGLALLVSPAWTASILIGAPFDTPADSVVGRVAAGALLALGVACWTAQAAQLPSGVTGIVTAMLIYNVITAGAVTFAATALHLFGVGLWPTVVVHTLMAVWCLVLLSKRS
jgi:hypothetical protein